MNSLESLKIARWKTGQSFVLRNGFFSGFSGISGVKSTLGTWAKRPELRGSAGTENEARSWEKGEKWGDFSGTLAFLFIGGLRSLGTRGVRSYAARTRTSCMSESSTASASDGTDRMGRVGWGGSVASHRGDVDGPRPRPSGTRGVRGYAARNSDEDADSSFGYYRIFDLNIYINYLINFKKSYLLHTNSVFDGLYIHA